VVRAKAELGFLSTFLSISRVGNHFLIGYFFCRNRQPAVKHELPRIDPATTRMAEDPFGIVWPSARARRLAADHDSFNFCDGCRAHIMRSKSDNRGAEICYECGGSAGRVRVCSKMGCYRYEIVGWGEDSKPLSCRECRQAIPDLVYRCQGSGCRTIAPQVCDRCRDRHYCSRECQRADWPSHKTACKARTPATSQSQKNIDSITRPQEQPKSEFEKKIDVILEMLPTVKREQAAAALEKEKGDVVNAVFDLSPFSL
jgi:NACalpha-BTF3-like transcription factor